MSTSTWKGQLTQLLIQATSVNPYARLAILGIGNELNGDDAAGILAARLLSARFCSRPNILVINGGSAPENFTAPIRRFCPNLLVIIDAAEMGSSPGTIACLHSNQVNGFSASTHSLPPSTLAAYLMEQTGCQIVMLAIQVQQLEIGTPISPPVQHAVFALTRTCVEAMNLLD